MIIELINMTEAQRNVALTDLLVDDPTGEKFMELCRDTLKHLRELANQEDPDSGDILALATLLSRLDEFYLDHSR